MKARCYLHSALLVLAWLAAAPLPAAPLTRGTEP